MTKPTQNKADKKAKKDTDSEKSIAEDVIENTEVVLDVEPIEEADVAMSENSSPALSDRTLLLVALMLTWIIVLAGGAYMYKELQVHKQKLEQSSVSEAPDAEVLKQRIAELETRIEDSKSAEGRRSMDLAQALEVHKKTVNRLAKLESIVQTLPTELPEISMLPDNIVNQDELIEILTRVKRLETIDEKQKELRQQHEKMVNVAPLLMGIFTLRDRVLEGESYEKNLMLLKKMSQKDAELLSLFIRLETYLAKDKITLAKLKADFSVLSREIYRASLGQGDGAWEKAKEVMAEAFTIRKVGEGLEGDSVEAILARTEIYLEQSQLSLVIKQLVQLKGKPANVARSWLNKARHVKAIENIFADIYDRATELSAQTFKQEQARSPIPSNKPIEEPDPEVMARDIEKEEHVIIWHDDIDVDEELSPAAGESNTRMEAFSEDETKFEEEAHIIVIDTQNDLQGYNIPNSLP